MYLPDNFLYRIIVEKVYWVTIEKVYWIIVKNVYRIIFSTKFERLISGSRSSFCKSDVMFQKFRDIEMIGQVRNGLWLSRILSTSHCCPNMFR